MRQGAVHLLCRVLVCAPGPLPPSPRGQSGRSEPSFKSGNLPKGDKVRGNVAFEVAPDAKGFVLTYQPLVILGGFQPIRIDLGQ